METCAGGGCAGRGAGGGAGGGGAAHGTKGVCQGTAPCAGGGAGIGAGDGFFRNAALCVEGGSPTAARKPPREAGAGLVGAAAFVAASGAGAEGTVWSRN